MNIQVVDFQETSAPAEFTLSLKNTGFAVLTNHPINFELVNAIYEEWEVFFSSDSVQI